MLIDIDIKQDYYYKEGRDIGAKIMSLHFKGNSAASIAKKLSIDVKDIKVIIEKYS